MGGRGGTSRVTAKVSYASFPVSLRIGGGKYATAQEKKQKRDTVSRFLRDARVGDTYGTGAGIGSAGAQFEVVAYNRSPNKLGLKWISGNRQPVALNRANIASFIANGATLVKRK